MAISFATFIQKTLQLAGQPTYPNSTPATPAEYANKVERTANQVRDLDADVIGFQELWDAQALTDVFAYGLGPWPTQGRVSLQVRLVGFACWHTPRARRRDLRE